MALFLNKFGDLRGKVGDIVFSANAAGAYMRSKVTPMNPDTEKQINARARLAQLASYYSYTLTDEQREGWRQLAAQEPYTNIFGDKRYLNGISMFVKVNSTMLLAGVAQLDTAPNNLEVRPLQVDVVSVPNPDEKEFTATITPTVSATEKLLFYCTPSIRPSINFVKNLYRFSYIAPPSSVNPVTLEVSPTIGPCVTGLKIWGLVCRLNMDTGGLTAGKPISAIVEAP